MIDYGRLLERFERLAPAYASAVPFPHAVLDDVFPVDVLQAAAKEFPDPGSMETQYEDEVSIKSTESRWEHLGPATRSVLAECNSGAFTRCLSALTGIDHLIVDAELVGAGQHQIRRGGMLKVHADFDRHVRTQLDRRLNVLVYLNEGWQDDWGGALELWDLDMTAPVVQVPPRLGTVVVFSTTDTSFHGHPDPLTCPPDRARKSLALYYYTSPLGPSAGRRTTDFRRRPGEAFEYSMPTSRRERLKRWVPPAAVGVARTLRGR